MPVTEYISLLVVMYHDCREFEGLRGSPVDFEVTSELIFRVDSAILSSTAFLHNSCSGDSLLPNYGDEDGDGGKCSEYMRDAQFHRMASFPSDFVNQN